eukprot:scaffold66074_cov36-Tisochrysis_lutea.AAC.1
MLDPRARNVQGPRLSKRTHPLDAGRCDVNAQGRSLIGKFGHSTPEARAAPGRAECQCAGRRGAKGADARGQGQHPERVELEFYSWPRHSSPLSRVLGAEGENGERKGGGRDECRG